MQSSKRFRMKTLMKCESSRCCLHHLGSALSEAAATAKMRLEEQRSDPPSVQGALSTDLAVFFAGPNCVALRLKSVDELIAELTASPLRLRRLLMILRAWPSVVGLPESCCHALYDF
jgi:hypothetical protein